MPRLRHASPEYRKAYFEQFEQRLVMSAQAVATLLPDLEPASFDVTQQIVSTPLNSTVSPTTAAANIAAQYGFDGKGQTVAVIDSGIAWDHSALGGGFGKGHKVVGGWDFAQNDANPYDSGPAAMHGTHVAGIVGSTHSTYKGVSSGVDLVSLRVFNDQGEGNFTWVKQALEWVHTHRHSFENPITTVVMSLGASWNDFTPPEWANLEAELGKLKQAGLFISVAAGNSFQDYNAPGLSYPAASQHVVPVASHNSSGNMSDFSQRASHALVAPGESVRSAVPNHLFMDGGTNRFMALSGTSMAAPYVAGVSAILRQANEFMGIQGINQNLLYQQLVQSAQQIFDPATQTSYKRVDIGAALAQIIPDLNDNSAATATNVGSLSGGEQIKGTIGKINDVDFFKFTASQTGIVRFQINSTHQLDAILNVIGSNSTVNGNEVTFNVQAGQQYTFSIATRNGTGHYTINTSLESGNTVSLHNGVLTVNGSAGNDVVAINMNNGVSVSLNGVSYSYSASQVQSIQIHSRGGNDSLSLNLGSHSDVVTTRTDRVTVTNGAYQLAANGFKSIAVDGGAGSNSITMHDSVGNDLFVANGSNWTLSGGGVSATASNFKTVTAVASGGHDEARFTGTAGNDAFTVRDGRTTMATAHSTVAGQGFETTRLDGAGGHDTVRIIESAGDRRFDLYYGYAFVQNVNRTIESVNMDRIDILAQTSIANVRIFDSAADDRFVVNNHITTMISPNFVANAAGFKDTTIISNQGNDFALIFDSKGDDHFSTSGNRTDFVAPRWKVTTFGVHRVNSVSIYGGQDTASLQGSNGNDTLIVNREAATISNSDQFRRIIGFHRTDVDLMAGNDQVTYRGSESSETLRVRRTESEYRTDAQTVQVKNATSTLMRGNGGGDRIVFEELDLLQGLGSKAVGFLNQHKVTAEQISALEARSVENAIAEYDLDIVDFQYLLYGNWRPK